MSALSTASLQPNAWMASSSGAPERHADGLMGSDSGRCMQLAHVPLGTNTLHQQPHTSSKSLDIDMHCACKQFYAFCLVSNGQKQWHMRGNQAFSDQAEDCSGPSAFYTSFITRCSGNHHVQSSSSLKCRARGSYSVGMHSRKKHKEKQLTSEKQMNKMV